MVRRHEVTSYEELHSAYEGKKALILTWEEWEEKGMDKGAFDYDYLRGLRARIRSLYQRITVKGEY